MTHIILAIIYLAFISLGLPGFNVRSSMAGYVCCVWSTALICRYLILHYFRGDNYIESAE